MASHHSAFLISSVKRAFYYHLILSSFPLVKVLLGDCIGNTPTDWISKSVKDYQKINLTDHSAGTERVSPERCTKIVHFYFLKAENGFSLVVQFI